MGTRGDAVAMGKLGLAGWGVKSGENKEIALHSVKEVTRGLGSVSDQRGGLQGLAWRL